MTTDELARSYFLRARKRMLALQTLMQAEAYPDVVREARAQGVHTTLSPILKTPDELAQGSLLDLDMIDEARILVDEDGLLRRHLDALAAKLKVMGARRVRKGGGYYWELKPDYRWGERITL